MLFCLFVKMLVNSKPQNLKIRSSKPVLMKFKNYFELHVFKTKQQIFFLSKY